jgi:hypothetical protein
MTDRKALAREIAARTAPRFLDIKPERKRSRALRWDELKASKKEESMPTIYISDKGNDENDGLSPQSAVYSLKRALKLQGGKNDHSIHFGPRAWRRIKKELAESKVKK